MNTLDFLKSFPKGFCKDIETFEKIEIGVEKIPVNDIIASCDGVIFKMVVQI